MSAALLTLSLYGIFLEHQHEIEEFIEYEIRQTIEYEDEPFPDFRQTILTVVREA